jgi:hypothetical protein
MAERLKRRMNLLCSELGLTFTLHQKLDQCLITCKRCGAAWSLPVPLKDGFFLCPQGRNAAFYTEVVTPEYMNEIERRMEEDER